VLRKAETIGYFPEVFFFALEADADFFFGADSAFAA
jgi:hypothetical protein